MRWVAPGSGWVKLNVDGASRGEGNLAGCGGLLRGSDGEWIAGFARKLGSCSANKAELWGVLTGLQVAKICNLEQIIVECDSVAVVQLLSKLQADGIADSDTTLLTEIYRFLQKFSSVACVHVYREGNKCADSLANLSFDQEDFFVCFDTPLGVIVDCLYSDSRGISYPRHILI
ncbi:hypothetical protein QN277_007613 [Acacia crassicarpa]|uniref:RNase H type-1 domain-containing protein n=1 Tax=Acacia crassicarpa TaxID=499986 RepID=A0AAE1IW96_9FABA|nr:hypothetical protein QN277_007613 [Acacia crassicarpa]